jgi:hypothetical protein
MAGTTGLEPATSAVTGQRSNQLSYVPGCFDSTTLIASKSKNILFKRLRQIHRLTAPNRIRIRLRDFVRTT